MSQRHEEHVKVEVRDAHKDGEAAPELHATSSYWV